MKDLIEVAISVGSNCAGRKEFVAEALEWLSSVLTGFRSSSIYETDAEGSGSGRYANAVVCGWYCGSVESLGNLCKEYERGHGRDGVMRSLGIVPVDIDVVICEGVILRPRDYSRRYFTVGYSQMALAGSYVREARR